MKGALLLQARITRDWEQRETAAKLKVSQPYLSLLETGKRPVTAKLASRAVKLFNLPPTLLPLKPGLRNTIQMNNDDVLASQLAALGYPKFLNLKKLRKINPASVLITALCTDDLESRVVEALPWLINKFPNMDWLQVTGSARLHDSQNRLGFLIMLALQLATRSKNVAQQNFLGELLRNLKNSLLARDDSFQRTSMTRAEKAWLKKNRPPGASEWHILSNLSAEYLEH